MKMFRLFVRHVDEESREVWFRREGFFATEEEAQAEGRRLRTVCSPFGGFVVRGPGEAKPKAGYCSEKEQGRLLRAEFDGMCREEQDAYMGR